MATKKTVQQIIKENKITTNAGIQNFLKGKTITLTQNCGTYGCIGDKIKLENGWMASYNTTNSYIYLANNGNALHLTYCTIGGGTLQDLTDEMAANEKQMMNLESENKMIAMKIAFMKEHGLTEYDEELFKVFEILNAMEAKKGSKMDKAMVIAKILKS